MKFETVAMYYINIFISLMFCVDDILGLVMIYFMQKDAHTVNIFTSENFPVWGCASVPQKKRCVVFAGKKAHDFTVRTSEFFQFHK